MNAGELLARPGYTLSFCSGRQAGAELDGGAAARLLGPSERAAFSALASDKRRRDWLAGRIAGKRALAAFLGSRGQRPPEQAAIEILNGEGGQPYARCEGEARSLLGSAAFSISHCAAGGLCAVAAGGGPIGADWETVEPREPAALALYCRPEELEALGAGPEGQTRAWTMKEAVLKFLGLGLACDPLAVRLRGAAAAPRAELSGAALRRWEELDCPPLRLDELTKDGALIAVAY